MVPRLCVMTTNWVVAARARRASANRPMLASSSAASTSSRTQNGTGRTSSIANSRATAVRARSPPDSIASACGFLPGGLATISTPVAERSAGSVRLSCAWPPARGRLDSRFEQRGFDRLFGAIRIGRLTRKGGFGNAYRVIRVSRPKQGPKPQLAEPGELHEHLLANGIELDPGPDVGRLRCA